MLKFRKPVLPVHAPELSSNLSEEDIKLIEYLNNIYKFTFLGFTLTLLFSFIISSYFVNFYWNFLGFMFANFILTMYVVKKIHSLKSLTLGNNKEKFPKNKIILFLLFCVIYPLAFLPGLSYLTHHQSYYLYIPILFFNTIGNFIGIQMNLIINKNSFELEKECSYSSFIGGCVLGSIFTIIFGFNFNNILFCIITNIFLSFVTYVYTEKGIIDFSKENLDSIHVTMSLIFDLLCLFS